MQKQAPRDNTAMRWGPRLDGDLRKPRIAKCTNEEEIMNLMASVRWEHIRMGITEATLSKKDSLVPALAYLAKHGWNDNLSAQLNAREEQFKNIEARLIAEKLEEQGRIGRSTMSLLIPAYVMDEVRSSPDPRKTALEWREKLANLERLERRIIRKRAVEALGEIGTSAAIAELVKLLFCTEGNADMWAASALNHAASENPKEVIPVLRNEMKALGDGDGAEKAMQILNATCERVEGKA